LFQDIIYTDVNYSTSSYHYTVPVTGIYLINVNIATTQATINADFKIGISINGSLFTPTRNDYTTTSSFYKQTIVVSLTAGSIITVGSSNDDGQNIIITSGTFSIVPLII
jgi:hypothetical protein